MSSSSSSSSPVPTIPSVAVSPVDNDSSSSSDDSVSIRCQFLITPTPSPPASPVLHSSDTHEQVISPNNANSGTDPIDISSISIPNPHPTPIPTKDDASTPTNTTHLNANASNFVPSTHHTPPDGTIDIANSSSQVTPPFDSATAKTPNVYINGLPPHYPEEQLYSLAIPFGGVRSVRTFTRHIGDRESGYGFVLFDSIDSAERCINSLRRYRNLHPTFSKQIHKIPGTQYASSASMPAALSSLTAATQWTPPADSPFARAETFKERMERLADPSSTNLYIEGLPLSVDEHTLSALVSPHHIKSSRFFQTRLSNPPRIIAFVRLDTRLGAEEVIERLHGRMVRGWNDTGSRISVRFADTSEQRELRRTERAVQDGGGPTAAKLTMAQAALLNLRGKDKTRMPISKSLDVMGTQSLPPVIGTQNQAPLNLHHLVPDHRPVIGSGNASTDSSLRDFAPNHVSFNHFNRFKDLPSRKEDDHHHMMTPYDTIQSGNSNRSLASHCGEPDEFIPFGTHDLDSSSNLHHRTQSRNGYTPTEEYILQAHVAQQRKTGGGIPFGNRHRGAPAMGIGIKAARNVEEEFHSTHGRKGRSVDFAYSSGTEGQREEMKRSPFQAYMPTPHIPSDARNMEISQHHIRSTTVPQTSHHGKRTTVTTTTTIAAAQRNGGDGLRLGLSHGYPSTEETTEQKQRIDYSQHNNYRMKIDTRNNSNSNNNNSNNGNTNSTTDSQEVIVSPTLTYSSRTPSTLSPSTPQFFGSFGGTNESSSLAFASENLKGSLERKRLPIVE